MIQRGLLETNVEVGDTVDGRSVPIRRLRLIKKSGWTPRGSHMDTLFSEPIASGVTMYLVLFGLVVFGGIAFYVGYKVFGVIMVSGSVALLAALAFELFP